MKINVRKMYNSIFRNEFCSKIILTGTGNIIERTKRKEKDDIDI
jgi:hypothetical protein